MLCVGTWDANTGTVNGSRALRSRAAFGFLFFREAGIRSWAGGCWCATCGCNSLAKNAIRFVCNFVVIAPDDEGAATLVTSHEDITSCGAGEFDAILAYAGVSTGIELLVFGAISRILASAGRCVKISTSRAINSSL